jgi:hypothetical protein
MVTRVKLSELEAARARMTSGEWKILIEGGCQPEPDRACGIASMTHDRAIVASDAWDECSHPIGRANADGIVATHNAADALIRIARAALAWRQADERHRNHESAIMQADFDLTEEFHQREAELDNIRMDAEQALIDALEGVEL